VGSSGRKPATAGYSGTPLPKKLGIREGDALGLIGAPPDYLDMLGPLPEGVRVEPRLGARMRFVHFFARDRVALARELGNAKRALADDGMLWISWPKKTSGVRTDLDENVVRKAGLAAGLVDVKVCAVDETWSGLKFVYRLADRGS
jgi:hypothetical protein